MSKLYKRILHLDHKKKAYRHVYTVDGWDGTLRKKNIKDFYFIGFDKKNMTVELTNSSNSEYRGFISYLNPNDALRAALEWQKECIMKQASILVRIQDQLVED